jgi:uncharacterized protein YlaI
MKAICKNCGKRFSIDPHIETLIYAGIIKPVEVNLCQECAEVVADLVEWEEYLYNIVNEL